MSKSMAIDGVMKIFLMVAVIIVGMSFLMKAFGIDFFDWIESLFSGLGIPESGRALHVKIDPGDTPVEVWEFHLTDEKKHLSESKSSVPADLREWDLFFYLEKFQSNCAIFTTDEEGFSIISVPPKEDPDKGSIYYVTSGTVIQDDKTSIFESIKTSMIERTPRCDRRYLDPRASLCIENNCRDLFDLREMVACEGPYNYVNCKRLTETIACDNDDNVIKQDFSSITKWKCEGNKCNLLDRDNQAYKIKYGLICDDGIWKVCKEKPKEPEVSGDLFNAECTQDGDKFIWYPKKIPTYKLSSEGGITAWLWTSPPLSELDCTCGRGGTCDTFINEPNVGKPTIGDVANLLSKWDDYISTSDTLEMNVQDKVVYFFTYIYSLKDQEVRVDVKGNDGIRAWLNGVLISDIPTSCNFDGSMYTKLNKGSNNLLIRVGNDDQDSLSFSVKLKDSDDNPLEDVLIHLNEPLK